MHKQFIQDVRDNLDRTLRYLYLPKLAQGSMSRNILHALTMSSAMNNITIRSVSILEIADNEYVIKVNHDIELVYIVGKEATNA